MLNVICTKGCVMLLDYGIMKTRKKRKQYKHISLLEVREFLYREF